MQCRKCGTQNQDTAWVCSRCEYILDSSFLGNDILNERTRDGIDDDEAPADAAADAAADADMGGDALILGKLDDAEVESFVSDRTGGFLPSEKVGGENKPASVYVTGEVSKLMLPGTVLQRVGDANERSGILSPFEKSVLDMIDGHRTLLEIQDNSGLSFGDLRVAVAMLHDKALVEAVAKGARADHRVATQPLLDDATSNLSLPEAEADQVDSIPNQTSPFDELSMEALPPPTAPPPSAGMIGGVDNSVKPALRPALRAAAVPAAAPVAKPAAAAQKPVVPIPGSTGAMKPAPAHDAVSKARAASYYELAQKDLAAGRLGRAWGYAQLAAENDPGEEKYAALLRDWDKLPGVRAGDKASTPQELMSAAQQAENGGDYDKAVSLLQRLVEQAPASAAGWNKLAVLLATRIKDFKPAYDAAIKAVELEPGNMAYQSNMMKILSRIDSDEKKVPGSGGSDNKGLLGRLLRR